MSDSLLTGAQALVRTLEDLEVTTIFGYPGGANLPIYDALRESSIEHILVRHEQGAVLMAEGYAKIKKKPGVCLVTSGPGATNIVTGLADAMMDSVPIVAITGQIPRNMVGTDAFQEVDCFNLTMPITKHNELIFHEDDLIPAIRNAFYISNTGRKGPTLLDIPKDLLLSTHPYNFNKTRKLPGYRPNVSGHIGQIKKALKALKRAKYPLLMVGGGILNANAVSEFIEFANLTGIPIVRTLMGKGIVEHTNPRFIGMIGTHGSVKGNKAIHKADVIFAIGVRFSDRSTMGLKEKFAPQADFIHLDIDPAEIGKTVPVKIPIVGDIATVLKKCAEEYQKNPFYMQHPWVSSDEPRKSILPKKDHAPIMATIFEELSKMDAPLHITTDVGRHQMWATHHCTNPKHLPLITSGGLGTMGFGLPAAIGAWFADPKISVVNITGDGSFMMNMQEFILAVEYKIPLTIILINDYKLGMIKELQDKVYHSKYIAHDFNRDVNFVKLAEAMGGHGIHVTVHQQINSALHQAISSKKPTLIDFELEKLATSIQLKVNTAIAS